MKEKNIDDENINNNYVVYKQIGEGKFGEVFLGMKKETKEYVAIKSICKYHLIRSKVDISIEIGVLERVKNHDNLINLIEVIDNNDKHFIITEYCPGGDLYKKMQEQENKRFSEIMVTKYLKQIIPAIKYLHSLNIIHRDIKPENIVLVKDDKIKICDFGWSVLDNESKISFCGTLDYLSPEMVNSKPHDHRVDIWSLGVLTYELLTGNPPFMSYTHKTTYINILDLNYVFPHFISDKAKNFITGILKINPDERMSLDEMLEHPFLH